MMHEPTTDGWIFIGISEHGHAWQHISKGLRVISNVENVSELGPTHHVSVSKERGQATDQELEFVAECFSLDVETEDNDGSDGTARHLWGRPN